MSSVQLTADKILIDGQETRIISGSLHYFRVLPEYWRDRLEKLAELGCNTVDTYIAWNLHEREEGRFDFSGALDFTKFFEEAKKAGLYVIVRPGPYICSEWEFGGLPWWLLRYPNMALRANDKNFMRKVQKYLKRVCALIKPYLITNGGNIIFVQLENEYGSFGTDKNYLCELKSILLGSGIDVPLFTSDGDAKFLMDNGTLPDVWKTVNYRSETVKALDFLTEYQKDLPVGIGELWNGRASRWGQAYYHREVEGIAETLRDAIERAPYVNLYMFHGGTSFGFMNGGVIENGRYYAQMTSYDVDAPLNECGDRTQKYYAEQNVIHKVIGKKNPPAGSAEIKKASFKTISFQGICQMFSHLEELGDEVISPKILTMEETGQGYGYILYSTEFVGSKSGGKLILPEVRDSALVYIDGIYRKTVSRNDEDKSIDVDSSVTNVKVDILVVNLGRVNYGPKLSDRKGLVGDVLFYENEYKLQSILHNWRIVTLPLIKLPQNYDDGFQENMPAFYRYSFQVDTLADTFVLTKNFSRGAVFINGFNLGRHWNIGPQKTLYLPAPLLKKGPNEIIVFDERVENTDFGIELIDEHLLTGPGYLSAGD